jgi:PilZ domain-containing protein/tetratricopeptide repeat protein
MQPISRSSMSDVYLWDTYDKLGREALDSGDLVQANEAFRSAVATAEELQSHDRMVLSLRNLAATMMDMNQVSDAHELLLRTLDVAEQNLDEDHSQTVETQRDLAHICQQLGYLDKADELLKRVLEQELKLKDPDRIGSTLLTLAQVAQARQEPTVSAAYLQRVVKLKRQKLGDDHPEVAQSLLWLSTALYQCDKKDDAQKFMRKAFGLMERQFADEPSHLAQSLLAGAKMMVDAGQLEPALVHQKRALDIFASILDPNDDKLWETREYIATTLAAMGKLEEAIEILEFCFRNGDLQGARAGATYKNLAGLYLALDKKETAEELYEKASDILEATLGVEHPAYLATQEERIQLYHYSGRTRLALDVALKTIKATEKRFGAGHPNTAQAYASTALLAHSVEEWDTALELMRAAEKIWMSLAPRPEDVLANCRTNMATCLIKLKRFEEADPILQLAEGSAGQALAPIIAELRKELEAGRNQIDQPTEPPRISDTPVQPSFEKPPSIIFDSSVSELEPETEPAARAVEFIEDEEDLFGGGIDLFDPETGDDEEENPEELFPFEDDEEPIAENNEDLFGAEASDIEEAVSEPDPVASPRVEDAPRIEIEPEEDTDALEFPEDLEDQEAAFLDNDLEPVERQTGAEDSEETESTDVLTVEAKDEATDEPAHETETPEPISSGVESKATDSALFETDDEDDPESIEMQFEDEEADALELFAAEADDDYAENEEAEEGDAIELVAAGADDNSAQNEESEESEEGEAIELVAADTDDDSAENEESEESEESEAIELVAADTDDDSAGNEESEESEESEAIELVAADTDDDSAGNEESEESEEGEAIELVAADTDDNSAQNEESDEFQERRVHARSPLSFNRFFDIKVSVDDDYTEGLKSYLVDLGLGGIRINSEEPFPKETDVTLNLPEGVLGEAVELRAEVVWQKALYGASFIQGLAFKDLSKEQKELIRSKLDPEGSTRVNSRQHFRLYRPFPIKLQASGQDEWQASYATDLSVNGLGTRLKAPLEQGNSIRLRLELEFELPTVEVEAKVAWSRSGENGVSHGLQFAAVGPVEAKTIKRYIDRCLDFLPD